MRSIRTFEDLVHGVANSLTLISSQAQYLLARQGGAAGNGDELRIICKEAERAANLLGRVGGGPGRSLGPEPGKDSGQGNGGDGKGRS